jgi:hypothetical protein
MYIPGQVWAEQCWIRPPVKTTGLQWKHNNTYSSHQLWARMYRMTCRVRWFVRGIPIVKHKKSVGYGYARTVARKAAEYWCI